MSMTVKAIQKALNREETGNYDAATRAAVVEFQKAYNVRQEEEGSKLRLRTDGVVDMLTQVALGMKTKAKSPVLEIQRALGLEITNNYDAVTRAAVIDFQKNHNEKLRGEGSNELIREDGVVDPKTAKAMGISIH